MAKYVAVNQIEYLKDKKNIVVIKPGEVLPSHFSEQEIQRLVKLRAVRKMEIDMSIPAGEVVQDEKPAAEAATGRAALEARANELGVKFRKNTTDEKLAEDVAAAEADEELL